MHKKYPLVSSIIAEFASDLEIELIVEPVYGHAGRIKTKDGRVFYYRSSKFDINSLGASEIAKDKTYATFFMNKLGYTVPVGESFYSDYWCDVIYSNKNIAAAVRYAKQAGFPVIVKPNSESQGRGVEKVYNKENLIKAMLFIFDELKDRVAIIQKVVLGDDYRIVVLKDEVLCAYRRTPLTIVGDGDRTIIELLNSLQKSYLERGRNTVINKDDPRIIRTLQHEDLSFSSVLPEGKKMQLLTNANLSSGGQSEDVTSIIHKNYRELAVRLSRDMGLKFCGVDLITSFPIDKPLDEYVIIEVNAAPGLDYYAEAGEIQKEIVKKLYKKLLQFLINKENLRV
jgi:D-alanine-D-alanine ligase-like ATP-grasp enzyme